MYRIDPETIRIPEEREYRAQLASHPGLAKLKSLVPEAWEEDEDSRRYAEAGNQEYLRNLRREAVRISLGTRPDIFAAVEETLRMFGAAQSYEIFVGRDDEDIYENAFVSQIGEMVVIEFVNDFLALAVGDETRSNVGHELAHYLLGHIPFPELDRIFDVYEALNSDDGRLDPEVVDQMLDDREIDHLFRMTHVLAQLQELSADRVGLLVSRNLYASIMSEIKLSAGNIGQSFAFSVDDYLQQADPITSDDRAVYRTHPFGPQRARALRFFYDSDLYRGVLGAEGGQPITEFSVLLPEIIPLVGTRPPAVDSDEILTLDNYLLEVVLLDRIASVDRKLQHPERRVIEKHIPFEYRDKVLERADRALARIDEEKALLQAYIARAKQRDPAWKKRFLTRLLEVARAAGGDERTKLDAASRLAAAIDARDDWKQLCIGELGLDPYRNLGSGSSAGSGRLRKRPRSLA